MKQLAIVLLLGVFIRHDTANWIAASSGMSPAAVFYILGGAWEFVLCGLLLWAVCGYYWTIWSGLASAALVIGMIEGAQVSLCRLAIQDIRSVPQGTNLCDYVTGLPVGAVLTTVYVLLICWHFGRFVRERSA